MDRAASLREKLHHYIDIADEQKLRAIFKLLEEDIDGRYSSGKIADLHQRRLQHLQGLSKSYTMDESVQAIRRQKN
jgi:hypothetical protein